MDSENMFFYINLIIIIQSDGL